MRVGSGKVIYQWIDNWAKMPDTEDAQAAWAHPGIVATEAGEVITVHQDGSSLLLFDKQGSLKRSWKIGLVEAHGITLVKEGETHYLWIADNGSKRHPRHGYEYPPGSDKVSGQVVKMTLDGQTVLRLEKPPLPIYGYTRYAPTSVAVNEERLGGTGDVWVADGYGASYVHRFSKNGDYISTINGEEGRAGRFNCPHGIFIDRRKAEPELYIADRTNKRIQVYDLRGRFKRAFGQAFLSSPSAFAVSGNLMFVAELRARVAVLDAADKLVCYLGDNEEVCSVDGWPNNRDKNGRIVPSRLIQPGKFNSPHGIAADPEGNLYVAEWLIGGRIIKLARV